MSLVFSPEQDFKLLPPNGGGPGVFLRVARCFYHQRQAAKLESACLDKPRVGYL